LPNFERRNQAAVAALRWAKGKRIGIIISGGNIDL
jgi:hypothetical protein